jgi:excisionase family DNA binding protein
MDPAPRPAVDLTPVTRDNVLSTAEVAVADLLGIPRSAAHQVARRGDLPARRVGRRWLFLRDRLTAAVAPLDDPAAESRREVAQALLHISPV